MTVRDKAGVESLPIFITNRAAELAINRRRTGAETPVGDVDPSVHCRVQFSVSKPVAGGVERRDVDFIATPNGVALTEAPALAKADVGMTDLACHYRMKDMVEWENSSMCFRQMAIQARARSGRPTNAQSRCLVRDAATR